MFFTALTIGFHMAEKLDAAAIEKKWQARWLEENIWQANRPEDISKPKFYLMFAYPGVSGYLHVGHMRGYTYSDVICRYKRMTGHNVLFPVGTHPTGNVAITPSRKIQRGDPDLLAILRDNGCDEDTIERLKDPEFLIDFFNDMYVNEYWKKFGFLADWHRFTTTTSPGYRKFIEWQFRKLNDIGMLTQKPYFGTACMNCGPVAVDASETDISSGGSAEKQEFTLLKFKFAGPGGNHGPDGNGSADGTDGKLYAVAATLRPETVFGQTNFWVNPDVEYVKASVGDETWILSREAAEKLSFQKADVRITGSVSGKSLIGRFVIAPMINREIPILPSKFTDPDFATGLVTSVPSDAPYDWMALRDLADNPGECAKYGLDCGMVKAIKPIPIIDSKGWGPEPAVEICEKMGIASQDDPRLEDATREIYKAGFHTGRMNERCGEFAGKPVFDAKDEVKEKMLAMGVADIMYDLSEPVTCRCGGKVIVKQIPDQWFIDYGHEEATAKTLARIEGMNIMPQEYKDNLPGIIDWFKERACARLGNWLGTPLPFDERWMIEPISDSTLYSAYYLVSNYVNEGKLAPENLTEEFFDYVYLGLGNPAEVAAGTGIEGAVLESVKADFDYWYPLDINLGGKEHQTVHFPVFLMNHAAILAPEHFPRGLFVNWWISGKAGKMSKSKGGAEPIPDAASTYTVDGMRLYYCHIANPHVDVEWDPAAVKNCRQRVERVWNFMNELMRMDGGAPAPIDSWLESRVHTHIGGASEAMGKIRLREAANIIYFDVLSDIKWYLRRGGKNAGLISRVLKAWIRMMAPFTPHVAEELWEMNGGTGLVSVAGYPMAGEFSTSPGSETSENYLRGVRDDITGILKMTGISPKRIILYTASSWKYDIQSQMVRGGKDMGAVMKDAMADPEMRGRSKQVGAFASKIAKEMKKHGDATSKIPEIDELAFLRSGADFLSAEFNCAVEVYSADDPEAPDPGGKKGAADPFKPAIFIE